MSDEKKTKEQNIFAHLGGRLIQMPDPPEKPVDTTGSLRDLSALYGPLGGLVYAPPDPEESKDSAQKNIKSE